MAEPLRSSLCSTTSPGWGGFLAGKARAKGAPLVGSWPSLRGLRGFAALPRPRTYSFRKYFILSSLFTTPANSLIMVLCNFMPTYV